MKPNQGGWNLGRMLFFLGFLMLIVTPTTTAEQRLNYFLHEHPDISLFFSLLQTSQYLRSAIMWKTGTLFVPKNEAINEFLASGRSITNTTLMYHFSNNQLPYSELEKEYAIPTEVTGNAPILITKMPNKKGIFLNDAKYIIGDFRVFMQSGENQAASATFVHIIDRVLDPAVPGTDSPYLHNPDAGKFLDHISAYDVSNHQLATVYREQVSKLNKIELFKKPGYHTFFIPVDAAFKDRKATSSGIDAKVIHGHIIPNACIFLRTLEGGEEYETYEPSRMLDYADVDVRGQQFAAPKPFHTVISFEKSTTIEGNKIWLINSVNRQGDEKHRKGVVQAEIVRGNIPVKNGVVHLINKPLVIIDMTVFQTFEWYATKQQLKSMWGFLELYRKLQFHGYGADIRHILLSQGSPKGLTLFVPSNDAIEKATELRLNNMTAIEEILRLHILEDVVSAEDMMEHSKMKKFPFQVQTAAPGKKLLFSYFLKDGEKTIHVEGGGVNATVTQADFGATNGYIHIIDRVLGLPDQTVQEKMRIQPMLQSTYQLWRKANLDDTLNQSETLTIFAPSDTAWNNIRRISDDAYQNFFHSTSSTHNQMLMAVLERHFILNQVYSIQDLASMSVVMGNKTVSKGMKGNWTIPQYPIQTYGPKGFVKVNESRTLLFKSDFSQTSTPLPSLERQKTTGRSHDGDESHYYIYWNRMWAHVIRPNVRCTNGIIHIIDDVLMDSEEITVAAAPLANIPILLVLIPTTLLSLLSLQTL